MKYGISEPGTVTTVEKGNGSESAATKVRRIEKAVISESGSAPGTVRKIELRNYDFVVENYSGRKGIGVGKRITSDEFVVGGHRWAIYLYPQGLDDDAHNGGYTSLFIAPTSETTEPVQILNDIYILDQSGKLDHWGLSQFFFKQVGFISRGDMTGCPHFISRATLDSPDSPYLKDDCLKISVCIGVFTYHIRNQQQLREFSSKLDFNKLLERQWHDEFVFFQVADTTFCAAKSIIAARCPTLLSHLSDEHQFQDVAIPDVDPNIFKVALTFVCRGTLCKIDQEAIDDSDPLNLESFAAKLLAAADKFELKGLKKICESSISKKVSRESVVSLLHLADVCKAAELKSASLKFAARNRSVIMESDICELLKETCPLLFLEFAGLGDNFSSQDYHSTPSKKGVLNTVVATVRESLVGVRESLVGRYWRWGSPNKKQKIKEV